jgi:hypothetical protein
LHPILYSFLVGLRWNFRCQNLLGKAGIRMFLDQVPKLDFRFKLLKLMDSINRCKFVGTGCRLACWLVASKKLSGKLSGSWCPWPSPLAYPGLRSNWVESWVMIPIYAQRNHWHRGMKLVVYRSQNKAGNRAHSSYSTC